MYPFFAYLFLYRNSAQVPEENKAIMSDSSCDPNYKHADFSKYRFEPSLGVNVLFVVLFTLTTGLHLAQFLRTRTWYLAALLIGGCCTYKDSFITRISVGLANLLLIGEVIGYIGRAIGAKETPGC